MIQPRSLRHPDGLSTGHRLFLTLLFLGAVELRRTWDLLSYTGDGLALLTGRKRAYSYRYAEEFLVRIAQASGAERLTDTLARWTALLISSLAILLKHLVAATATLTGMPVC